MVHGVIVVSSSDSQSRESGFELNCFSSLSCINEYLAIDSSGYVNRLCAVIAAWLNVGKLSWCWKVCWGVKCKAL